MAKIRFRSPVATETLSQSLTILLGLAVGVIAANLYYAQPLTAQMAASLGLDIAVAGLVVTLMQAGYGIGVLFLVPLADLVENRKLILSLLCISTVAVLGIGFSTHLVPYFIAAFVAGFCGSAVQIIVPYAAHLAPEIKRGQVVGSLMSGLMLGIMLSRPIAGVLADMFSWHAVFFLSAGLMSLLAITLFFYLPPRQPSSTNIRYKDLLMSMAQLVPRYSTLRRRSIYQAFMFAAFCLFWTATPLLLAGPEFHLSQTGIALFALVGVGGAILAPIAGKIADRGWTRLASIIAMGSGCVAFLITHLVPLGSNTSLFLLTLAAVLLDGGVTANLVLGQREIFSLAPEFRGRLNSIYVATVFVGGAFGSFIGAWAYAHGAWSLTSAIGFFLPFASLLIFFTEKRSPKIKIT